MGKSSKRPIRSTKLGRSIRLGFEALENRLAPTCNLISGFVYQDANNNGILDFGEQPIANSTIQLRNAANQVVGTTTTNAQGYYEFDHDSTISVAPTSLTKIVSFQNTSTDFTLTGLLDRFDPELGELQSIEITHDGTITSEIKVENFSGTSSSSISGNVGGFLTLVAPGVNHNLALSENVGSINLPKFDGVIDFAGASGATFGTKTAHNSALITLTGAQLTAYIGTGTITVQESSTATSSAGGGGNIIAHITSSGAATITVVYKYIPSNCLVPGNYTIIQTTQPAGLLDGTDAKNNVPIAGSIGTDTIAVTLGNADLVNNNFGELPPPQLSGYVYHDINNNGVKDAGEEGIAGAVLNLTGVDDLGPVNKSATTDANGLYQFLNLRPGTYNVAEAQPGAYMDGKDAAGSTGGTVANDLLSAISLPVGAASVNNNFGELKPAAISGFVYVDANNNGFKDPNETPIAGVAVSLSGFTADGPVSKQATTDGSGFYSFSNLTPGTYGIQETQPGSYMDGKDAIGTQGGTAGNDQISNIALASGVNGQNNNFGELNPATVSGFVFADANNNGIKDSGENPIAGAIITLTGSDDVGAVSKTAATDATGFYQFLNLRPGTYTLTETQPAGFIDGKDAIGSQGGVTGNDSLTNIVLAQGVNGQNNNFGELPSAGLSGFVYIDVNDNGLKEVGEAGISGVTVTLTGVDDVGIVNLTAQTDSTGFYRFPNLRPGSYTISQTQPAGFNDGKDAIGTQGGTTGNDQLSNITLAAGVLGANNNFGEINPANADLRIVKTASAPVVRIGDQLTYTLTVTNLGTFTAENVLVTDDLPIDAGFVSAFGSGWAASQSGGVVTATRGALAAGASVTLFITIIVPTVSNTLVNHTHVSSTTPDYNPLNNDSTVSTPVVVDPKPIPKMVTQLGLLQITSKQQLIIGPGVVRNVNIRGDLAFLDGAYRALLGRRPTNAELNSQFTKLARGTSRLAIIRQLWATDAHRVMQARSLYQTYLHRLPTPGEQNAAVRKLKTGVQENTIAAQLLSSSEYLAAHPTTNTLVGGLYLDVLGTLPDAGTHQNLVQAMDNQTVMSAVQNMLTTQQALQISINSIYRNVLRRAATASEKQFGALQLQSGVSQSEIAIKLLASAHFYNKALASLRP